VPGARLVPLQQVPTLVGSLPTDEPVYLVCAVGGRSAQAAQFLSQQGVDAVNVHGGTSDWVDAGFPVER
jgi:rhodanese-related sulfurtransferase